MIAKMLSLGKGVVFKYGLVEFIEIGRAAIDLRSVRWNSASSNWTIRLAEKGMELSLSGVNRHLNSAHRQRNFVVVFRSQVFSIAY